ncbi:tartrate dehydratase subunit alpha [Paenibacillus sp. FSL P4-0081]|uniref:DUF5071 domain-containing protein n=1 Tax=Paenibacillus sp. FSL P4-0081 TaxID=1536769 RepID=UPI0004F7B1D5|nr:DUF5071 domain-containing protein [Paenibacillus sp. FSL P4-0081]AIQ29919.1 tartrate dehydratase subunit alpha [Paenibacillus sp. FSL P4-0081]
MNDSFTLLPRDKHDFERVHDLKKLDKKDLIPFIPELLQWLQDINWPIAKEVANLLLTVPKETVPYIEEVLNGGDDIWKTWCLECYVSQLPEEFRHPLEKQIQRIAYNPTKGEELEEVHITARELLKDFS